MNKICKNIVLAFGAAALIITPLIASVPTQAKAIETEVVLDAGGSGGSSAKPHDENRNFLGMKPWYDSLTKSNGELKCVNDDGSGGCVSLSVFIWTAVANVASDISIVSAYVAIGFVLFGGYQYMFASGDAGKVQSGKKTITNASIGLVIIIMANVIFNTIRVVLSGGASNTVTVEGAKLIQADATVEAMEIIGWVVGIAGVVALGFVVLGALSYMTANGDAGKLVKAKNTILYALIGLLIVGLAEAIVAFVIENASKTSRIETPAISLDSAVTTLTLENNHLSTVDTSTSSIQTVITKELNEKTLG